MRQEVTLRLNCIESRDYPSTVVLQIHPYHLKTTSDKNLYQISNLQEETDKKNSGFPWNSQDWKF